MNFLWGINKKMEQFYETLLCANCFFSQKKKELHTRKKKEKQNELRIAQETGIKKEDKSAEKKYSQCKKTAIGQE